ncbi:hypothetical protein [Pseudonocardia alni]
MALVVGVLHAVTGYAAGAGYAAAAALVVARGRRPGRSRARWWRSGDGR